MFCRAEKYSICFFSLPTTARGEFCSDQQRHKAGRYQDGMPELSNSMNFEISQVNLLCDNHGPQRDKNDHRHDDRIFLEPCLTLCLL
jgi:hypothetical protein